ncbi:hypothetical protein DM02DRAFT_663099 [Periconia macrospinosa]|uniref:Uncharacterized protein n=1 Tax=Periconia macrospinosa TaxID=97972 RepID=A0A2V1D458_9PLEO|nr:hypothetical protein DM02DRAFT_663099 [Periconia macrospinosa]
MQRIRLCSRSLTTTKRINAWPPFCICPLQTACVDCDEPIRPSLRVSGGQRDERDERDERDREDVVQHAQRRFAIICIPAAVAPRIRALQTRLWYRLEKECILACLRDALERDPTYKASLLFDPFEDAAYYDEEDAEGADVALVLDRVKAVFQGTHLRKEHTMDENAW